MQVSVEEVSPVKRRLTIVVPASQVEAVYAKQIDYFSKNANIKGFRPGKAPLSYIEQRFGKDARQEALSEVMRTAFYEAVTQESLKPISQPEIEPKVVTANQPLEFVASFEILPEIVGPLKFAMDSVEKLVVEVRPEDIDYVIKQLCKQHIKWKRVDRPAQEQDRVVIDYYAIFEEKSDVENKITDYPVELGSHAMLPGFEAGLIGAKANEERTLHLTFPTDFSMPEKAGKPVDFVIQVKQVFEADAPEVNEEFIRKLGIVSGTLDDLREQIKQSLEPERERLVKEKLKEQVFKQLLEQNPMEVPDALVQREAKNIHDEIYSKHQHHDHEHHSQQELAMFAGIAKTRVTLGLLINAYAKQANLIVDKEKVNQRIQEIAALYENPQEVMTYLASDEQRSGIEAQVLENQVIDKMIEGIKVLEKSMSFAELKGIRTE